MVTLQKEAFWMSIEGWVKQKATGTEVVKLDTRAEEMERIEAPKRVGVWKVEGCNVGVGRGTFRGLQQMGV